MAVYTPDISGLQPYTGGGASQPNSVTLTLIQHESLSTRLFINTLIQRCLQLFLKSLTLGVFFLIRPNSDESRYSITIVHVPYCAVRALKTFQRRLRPPLSSGSFKLGGGPKSPALFSVISDSVLPPNSDESVLGTAEKKIPLSVKLFRNSCNGISTLGGFWTFLNGRRSLSALGLVHIFQRRKLEHRWHKDFPALHTKGGQPGSESAGIITSIRERLVDVGEDPDESDNLEAQRNSDTEQSNNGDPAESVLIPNSPTRGSGSEDILLLDVDLGLPVGEMFRSGNA
ncbi:hypothetical protein C8F04DRAFT_1294111 [Mycena alexandri]|uniref:Uncharacterized protein n=1 Tax=Mycena alexandri TaxID=1745969 RepID=A0AAD6WU87_9AGAR|nr:hypothetical protein C8F04DRAFT_1294111 [Mycena alexandri]